MERWSTMLWYLHNGVIVIQPRLVCQQGFLEFSK